ncbi:hypothetical protein Hs30E_15760 [Lactococcus hodotermopsidis]|uniref:Uncharacterized protein n=1 Tax=Pseudolactococcus hodotermopsidis TaxID=2709157 RepID=A0A6A0BEB8_9LACT|nr:hypothetical protein Hs30E_15760 [Lactococcus hodotermopsidis]
MTDKDGDDLLEVVDGDVFIRESGTNKFTHKETALVITFQRRAIADYLEKEK